MKFFYYLFFLNIILILTLISCFSNIETKKLSKPLSINKITQNETLELEKESVITKYFKNEVFFDNIKTPLLLKNQDPLALPIINLNSNDKLIMCFDDLNGGFENYYFSILHCTKDWEKSSLIPIEYIKGFTKDYIIDFESSFNTIQKYTHYKFEFPSENIQPLISGNYIIQVFLKDTLILNQRFMIIENLVDIDADINRASLIEYRNTKQEIKFTVKHPNLKISDPFSSIQVIIKQNNKDYDALSNLQPVFIRNNELIYNNENNTFWGYNEFRHFNSKSLKNLSYRIKDIRYDSVFNHIYLFSDEKRSFNLYSIEQDINGKFIVTGEGEANIDYAWIYFSIPMNKMISYGNLYIVGEFSNWELEERFRLSYDIERKTYEGRVYLKQGYYDYLYALHDTITNRIDISYIEGTHYETRNDYYIYIYYRDMGSLYDKLIGFSKTSSKSFF